MENNLRTEILKSTLYARKSNIVLELATGMGKSKLALEKTHQLYTPDSKILIVIPRNVLIQNWKDEFIKWGFTDMLSSVTFTTYVSLPNHAEYWDICIFDEAHHLSERCQQALKSFNISYSIFLSATLKQIHKDFIRWWCENDVEFISVSTRKAIVNEVLPDPEIILIPLELDTKRQDIILEKNKAKNGEQPLIVPYEKKWNYRSYKGALSFRCSQRQYYFDMSGLIEWYKKKSLNPVMKNIWLHKCNQRLQWLSMVKLPYTMQIIKKMDSRFIVFCNTIAESQALHIPAVNSKIGTLNLERFNKKRINSLVAVNCINEGVNCTDCKVGIFNAINASDLMQTQKCGRILRHRSPVLIIPFFKNTREEEIVRKWMEGFNSKMIMTKTIDEL